MTHEDGNALDDTMVHEAGAWQDASSLVAALEDSEWRVRLAALRAVGGHGQRTSHAATITTSVVAKLCDPNEDVRSAAVQTVGQLDPAILAPHMGSIISLLGHASEDVRAAAVEVLECAIFGDKAQSASRESTAREWLAAGRGRAVVPPPARPAATWGACTAAVEGGKDT